MSNDQQAALLVFISYLAVTAVLGRLKEDFEKVAKTCKIK
jgi:hypothetical protein